MGFRNHCTVCYLALYIFATSITVNSLELIRVPQKTVCCSGDLTRSALPENRNPYLKLVDFMGMANDNLKPSSLQPEKDPFAAETKFSLTPPPIDFDDDKLKNLENQKAYLCSKLPCLSQQLEGPVCACNFNTGKVVTFKNKCDLKKHNCRFDTNFKAILDEICPWEYESRRREKSYDYNNSKFYN